MPSPDTDNGSPSVAKLVWARLGLADKLFLFALLAYLIAGIAGTSSPTRLLLLTAVLITGFIAGVRWLRIGMRKAIWSLRNRLLVAYLFIALVPILLIAILAYGSSWALATHIALYLVNTELDERVDALENAASRLAAVPPYQRERAWERLESMLSEEFPRVDVLLEQNGRVVFPKEPVLEPPDPSWGDTSGFLVKDELLYLWARASSGRVTVTSFAPVTKAFLLALAPGLGDVTVGEDPRSETRTGGMAMRIHQRLEGEPATDTPVLPPARNRFDFEFMGGTNSPVALWDSPSSGFTALVGVYSRASAVLDIISLKQTQSQSVLLILTSLAVVFLIVETVSLIIGVSITRTITSAFSDLWDGTRHVQEGNFSHRIAVKGDDQLAAVSGSFNRMTENIEQLLVVSKEKERMQAELEIAREVQRQLYPKSVPALSKLELLAVCNPARTVSGDYYDYQALQDSSAVVAVGDVAGKGISAALLMATLQSSLRTHVRGCLDESQNSGNGNGAPVMSTSRLVSQLNEQLYADTSPEKYATFYFSVYDDESGVLTYTNAGHLPPVLFRKGQVSELDVNGMVVGAFPFAQYGESQLRMESGDLLLVFTDGITEPENEYGEMFGEERVKEVVLRHIDRDVDKIIKAVMEAVQEWTGSPELQDDMTILVARRR